MLNLPIYVGLDYHTKTIQVCVMDKDKNILANQSVPNDAEAVWQVVEPFGNNVHAAIEVGTGSANFADQLITQFDWDVSLAHAGYVARMKQTPDKSDFTDAKLLADLTRVGYVPRVWLPPVYIRNLRELIRHRDDLVKQCTQVKLRIRAALRNHRIVCPLDPWTNKGKKWLLDESNITDPTLQFLLQENYETIEFLNKKIDCVTSKMKSAVAHDDVVKKLLEQNGIGIITAITMRAIIGRFDRFRTGKQLAHFAGVSPRNNSSGGKTTTGGLVKAGDELLRKILIEAAHRLKRHDKKWKAMAERLRANGKQRCVIAAAVANRWVRWLFRQMVEPQRVAETNAGFLRHLQESTLIENPTDIETVGLATSEGSVHNVLP